MTTQMTEDEAVNVLAAAFVYQGYVTGMIDVPEDPQLRKALYEWGTARLPNGDAKPVIDQALKRLFGTQGLRMNRQLAEW